MLTKEDMEVIKRAYARLILAGIRTIDSVVPENLKEDVQAIVDGTYKGPKN